MHSLSSADLFLNSQEHVQGLKQFGPYSVVPDLGRKSHQQKTKVDASMVRVTVVPTKSDSDIILCLGLLSKQITCTRHLI